MKRIVKFLFVCFALLWASPSQAGDFTTAAKGEVSRLLWANVQFNTKIDRVNLPRYYHKVKYTSLGGQLHLLQKSIKTCIVTNKPTGKFFTPVPLSRLIKSGPSGIDRAFELLKGKLYPEVGGEAFYFSRIQDASSLLREGFLPFNLLENDEIQINIWKFTSPKLMLSLKDKMGNPFQGREVIVNVDKKSIKVINPENGLKSGFYFLKIFSDATDLGTKRVVVP